MPAKAYKGYRENLAKSLLATVDIKKGEAITAEKITVKSPGRGISPQKIDELRVR